MINFIKNIPGLNRNRMSEQKTEELDQIDTNNKLIICAMLSARGF